MFVWACNDYCMLNEQKVFISFFFKVPKRKKQVGVARGASGPRFRRLGESDNLGEEDQVVVDLEGDGDGTSVGP